MQTSTQVLIKLHDFSVSAAVILKALILQRCGSLADFFQVREKNTRENHSKMLWETFWGQPFALKVGLAVLSHL